MLIKPALTLAATVLLAAGCAGTPGVGVGAGPEQPTETSELPSDRDSRVSPGGGWQLVAGLTPDGPIDLPGAGAITLSIGKGQAGGTSTCNTYGTRVRVNGDRIRFRRVETTLIGCDDALVKPETAYYMALLRVREWQMESGRLILTGPGTELVFRPG